MNLNSLRNVTGARHRRKRLGRGHGSGLGKTSGKGHKGQMARSGHKHKEGFEGGQMPFFRLVPKRGFKNPNRKITAPVNLGLLDATFEDGAEVTLQDLLESGLVNGAFDRIKVLGDGEISKKLTVTAHAFSASAKAAIEQAGGTCVVAGAAEAPAAGSAPADEAPASEEKGEA
jgi:large subunit ribosomal protein L15